MSDIQATSFEARASGKVVLFGEYAVLEGGEALVYASARQVVARLLTPLDASSSDQRRYELSAPGLGRGSWEGPLHDSWSLIERITATRGVTQGVPFTFAWATLRALQAPSGHYHVDSEALGVWEPEVEGVSAWRKLGLGSSAASVSSLVALCAQLNGQALGPAERFRLTQLIHHQVQGAIGSGVDAAASAYGGLLRYRWHPEDSQPLPPRQPDWERIEVRAGEAPIGTAELCPVAYPLPSLAWVWMGRSASTTALVSQVRALRASQPYVYQERLRSISLASSSAYQALCYRSSDDRQRAFCDAVEEGGRAIQALGEASEAPIWTSEHSALQALIRPLGASLKPTGAGGGDLALACAPTLDAQAQLLKTCAEAGWELVEL